MTSPSRTRYSLPSRRSLPALLRAGLALAGDVVAERDDFGADEAALEVRVDHARGLRRGGARAHRPGAHFLRAGREIGLQAEQLVAPRESRDRGPAPSARARARKSARSASSSCEISASIAAHTATTTAPSACARFSTAARCGLLVKPLSVTFATYMTGFAVSSCSSRRSRRSSSVIGMRAHGLRLVQMRLHALEQRALANRILVAALGGLGRRDRPPSRPSADPRAQARCR